MYPMRVYMPQLRRFSSMNERARTRVTSRSMRICLAERAQSWKSTAARQMKAETHLLASHLSGLSCSSSSRSPTMEAVRAITRYCRKSHWKSQETGPQSGTKSSRAGA